jgi:hypothetical protein
MSPLRLHELDYAVNAYRKARDFIDEHVGRMHILQRYAVRGVIDTLTVPVVTEALSRAALAHCSMAYS